MCTLPSFSIDGNSKRFVYSDKIILLLKLDVVPTLVLSGRVKQIYSINFFVCLISQLRIDASEKLGTVVLSESHLTRYDFPVAFE